MYRPSLIVCVALAMSLAAASGCGGRDSNSALSTSGPRIYVSDETGGRVAVIDPDAGRVVTTLAVGKRPRGIRLIDGGRHVLVALSGSPIAGPGVDESKLPPGDRKADGIGVVDLASLKVARVMKSGQDPEAFAVSPDEKTVYVANEFSYRFDKVTLDDAERSSR